MKNTKHKGRRAFKIKKTNEYDYKRKLEYLRLNPRKFGI